MPSTTTTSTTTTGGSAAGGVGAAAAGCETDAPDAQSAHGERMDTAEAETAEEGELTVAQPSKYAIPFLLYHRSW